MALPEDVVRNLASMSHDAFEAWLSYDYLLDQAIEGVVTSPLAYAMHRVKGIAVLPFRRARLCTRTLERCLSAFCLPRP